jgi:MFS family permease
MVLKRHLKRNLLLIKITSILIKRVTMPIIVLYFLFNNLDFYQIGILSSLSALTVAVLEIPTGIFADKYGRKKSILIAMISGILASVFYLCGTFNYLVFASFLIGVTLSFISGSRISLFYDSLKQLGNEKNYKKEIGKVHFFSHIVNGSILLLIPVIYVFNHYLPFVIMGGFYFSALVLSLFLVETKQEKQVIKENVFLSMLSNKKLLLLMLFLSFSFSMIWITSPYYQPLMKDAGFAVSLFGIIYMGKRFILGIGARISYLSEKILKPFTCFVIIVLLIFLSYFSIYIGSLILIILGIFLFSLAEGFLKVIVEYEVHKKIISNNRATVLSVVSLLKLGFVALFAIFLGFYVDLFGIQEVFGRVLVFIIPVFLILFLIVYAKIFKLDKLKKRRFK